MITDGPDPDEPYIKHFIIFSDRTTRKDIKNSDYSPNDIIFVYLKTKTEITDTLITIKRAMKKPEENWYISHQVPRFFGNSLYHEFTKCFFKKPKPIINRNIGQPKKSKRKRFSTGG